jgi:hypothetical protein
VWEWPLRGSVAVAVAVALGVGVGLGAELVTSIYFESRAIPLVKTVITAGPGRKIIHRGQSKGGIRPACYRIDREEGDLAVVDVAQLHDG